MYVRKATGMIMITASEEQSDLGLHCLSRPFYFDRQLVFKIL